MSRAALICQGFQRAFVDGAGDLFSVSSSMRRATCERIVKCARASGWRMIHTFLDSEALNGAAASSIDGFAPAPKEPYFRQRTLSAFDEPGFHNKLEAMPEGPIFLISLAGLGAIAATFLDGLQRGLPIYIVTDAVADLSGFGVSEQERLSAIEILARAHNRRAISADLIALASLTSSSVRPAVSLADAI